MLQYYVRPLHLKGILQEQKVDAKSRHFGGIRRCYDPLGKYLIAQLREFYVGNSFRFHQILQFINRKI